MGGRSRAGRGVDGLTDARASRRSPGSLDSTTTAHRGCEAYGIRRSRRSHCRDLSFSWCRGDLERGSRLQKVSALEDAESSRAARSALGALRRQRRCITDLSNESYNHNPYRSRPRGVARVGGSARRSFPRANHSRSARKGARRSRNQAVHEMGGSHVGSHEPFGAQGFLEVVKGIADTGFLVAFVNRADRHHAWAVSIAERLTEPLFTCEPVLAEAAFHVRSSKIILGLVEDELVKLRFDVAENLTHLAELAQRYEARSPDLADLCIIRMSELHPRHSVVTVDERDFRVYRRNKREVIRLVCPPSR